MRAGRAAGVMPRKRRMADATLAQLYIHDDNLFLHRYLS